MENFDSCWLHDAKLAVQHEYRGLVFKINWIYTVPRPWSSERYRSIISSFVLFIL